MADRIRAGIVGVGFMGTVHARAVRRAGGSVSRIVGSSPESSRAGAERIGADFAWPGAARHSVVPAGHPQGYQDCFDAFVADTYAALTAEAPDGLPTFADGLRATHITQAVLDSSRTSSWVEVAA